MAQTKTKAAKKRAAPKRAKAASAKRSKSASAKSRSKPKAKAKSKAAKVKSTAKSAAKSVADKAPSSSNGASHSNGASSKHSNVEAVKHAVGKAKVPLVAGGAALVGAAGGMALAASKQAHKSGVGKAVARRPKIKLTSKDVARAAKEVGNFSAQVGELADELQRARKTANGNHRSPVEVVLQGLTARR